MDWIPHNGAGRPLPVGTLIDIRHFNGDVTKGFEVGSGATFDKDGTPIASWRARWSGWNYHDGGPMGVKFKAYRLCVDSAVRNSAMFASWLDVREIEPA